MLLNVDNVTVSYGGVRALRGISCQVEEGEIVALIGANGAGKSTTGRSAVWYGLSREQLPTMKRF